MAFWSKHRWLSEGGVNKPSSPVIPWDDNRVESAGYRLSIGCEVCINGAGYESARQLNSGEAFVIKPGQFAYILTKERVQINSKSIGFISIRASIKFYGLVNVSGFQVNPGYYDRLLFAVFNAGTGKIHLKQGDEIFSIWIANLDAEVDISSESKGNIQNLSKIPSEILNKISSSAPTAFELSETVAELQHQVRSYRNLTITVLTISVAIVALLYLNIDSKIEAEVVKSNISNIRHE